MAHKDGGGSIGYRRAAATDVGVVVAASIAPCVPSSKARLSGAATPVLAGILPSDRASLPLSGPKDER